MAVLTQRRKSDEDLFNETTMTFGEHLEELRVCLWKAVLGLMIGFFIGLYFGTWVVELIKRPLKLALQEHYRIVSPEKLDRELNKYPNLKERLPFGIDELRRKAKSGLTYQVRYIDPRMLTGQKAESNSAELQPFNDDVAVPTVEQQLEGLQPFVLFQPQEEDERTDPQAISATEGFMIWFKAAFVLGVIISAPWVFYQLWNFVASGLYRHERKYVYTFLPFSLGLFFLGAATAYLFVFDPVLNFLFSFNRTLGINPDPRMNEWISFVLLLPLGFGVSFQLPLVMLFLERIGIFTAKDFVEKWRIAILAIFVISAVLTPADPYSIFLMAVPLTVLYFGGILLTKYMPRGGRPAASLT
jgi:sec-independent protein translocase protein TatC